MKWNPKAFGSKLWSYFALFAAVVFAALWLLQTVFLQNFYDQMAAKNVKKAAVQIAALQDRSDLYELLDGMAYENSLLIFLTDRKGKILYSTDEHSRVYGDPYNSQQETNPGFNTGTSSGGLLSWQIGAARNLNLPQDYDIFLQALLESADGTTGYRLDNSSAYVYGMELPSKGGDTILYINASLEAVGSTVSILRTQLLWVTAASLLLSFAIAFFIARRFSQPIAELSSQARHMTDGNFHVRFEKGFCSELDELAGTLKETAERLSRTENFRREFLANISHDLRTPLTMIRGYAEMVRDFSWEDEDQRNADLSVIIRESNRLTGLVNDILEYTALQSESKPMEFKIMDLGAAAQEVLAQFEPLCTRGGYEMEPQIEPHLTVYGNQRQLSRVLYNLIDNAVSHSGDNKKVRLVLQDTGNTVRAEVHDFGKGISPNDLPYIWERYFTLKQQKRNEQGSGLGLAISKEILQAHGAEFGVHSEEGHGTVFWFELKKTCCQAK